MAGIDLPVTNTEHQYVITTPIPELEAYDGEVPVLRDLDGSYYLRQEKKGFLIGPYESTESMKVLEQWYDKGLPQGSYLGPLLLFYKKKEFHPKL